MSLPAISRQIENKAIEYAPNNVTKWSQKPIKGYEFLVEYNSGNNRSSNFKSAERVAQSRFELRAPN